MKKLLFACLILSSFNYSFSQKIAPSDFKLLRKKEDSLKNLAVTIIQGRTSSERFDADSEFTKIFVRALKIKNSFYYPFDSLITISQLCPADSSFKIFTWQMIVNNEVTRQHGAIQMRTNDGSLKLYPLIDKSDVTINAEDTIGNNLGWIGAVYYKIIETHFNEKNYYTLLGYDENNIRSNKKMADVLTFNNDEPIFGGPYFNFPDSSKKISNRFIMEYKEYASPRLNYDTVMNMIVCEHTFSETGEPQKKYTYIPDGDYDGLQWKDGKWVFVEKLFTQKLEDGQAPVPEPIRDAKGSIDETRLKDNEDDETATPPAIQPSNKNQKGKTGSKYKQRSNK